MSNKRSLWVYRLGECNQYRKVPCVERLANGFYVCHLCQTGHMPPKNVGSHFNGSLHAACYQGIKREEAELEGNQAIADRVLIMKSLECKVNQLGLKAWQSDVRAAMFEFVKTPATNDVAVLLWKYTKMEKLSLLELALWKSSICNGLTFSSVQEMREYVVLESDFDVNAFSREMRITSGSEVIIPLVSAFLGW